MSSTSSTPPSYVLNGVLSTGNGLSMGDEANVKMNKARSAAKSAAPVAPYVLNDALASDGSLSMGVVSNTIMNE